MAGLWNPSACLFIHSHMPTCSFWTGTASHHAVILNWIFVKNTRYFLSIQLWEKAEKVHLKNVRRAYEGGREVELGICKILQQFWDQDTLQCKALPLICSESLVIPLGVLSSTYAGICWMLVRDGMSNSCLSCALWCLSKKQENWKEGGRMCESHGDF